MARTMRAMLLFVLLITLSGLSLVSAQGSNVVIVNAGAANIRSGPAANTTSLGSVPGGTELVVTGRNADLTWWRVNSSYGVGWVSDELVIFRGSIDAVPIVNQPVGTLETATIFIDRYPATVYRNPNTDSFVIGIAPQGASLVVSGRTANGNWWQVETSAGTGFVESSKVAFRGDVTLVAVVTDPGPSFDGPTVRVNANTGVSSAPGGGTSLGTIPAGYTLPTGGRNADNTWWQVAGEWGVGWIPVSNISLAGAASNIRVTSNTTFSGPAFTGGSFGTVIIEADRKVAYNEASYSSPPMWDARLGAQGVVIGRSYDGLWLQVVFNNYTGWINFSGITLQANMAGIPPVNTAPAPVQNVAIVNTHRLNVRSGPGVEYSDLGSIPGGTVLSVTGRHPTLPWLRVEGDFGVGWVRIMFIVFRGNWNAVPEVTQPIGSIELPIAVVSINWQVYSQPDLAYPAGLLAPGEYTIIGRTADYTWGQLQTPTGNVWMPYAEIVLRGVESLIPVVQ